MIFTSKWQGSAGSQFFRLASSFHYTAGPGTHAMFYAVVFMANLDFIIRTLSKCL